MKNLEIVDNYPTTKDPANSKIHLVWYLIPVIGFFPSLWTLYRRQGSREQLTTSRLSVILALTWLLGNFLFTIGAATTSELFTLRLLLLNTFLTSGYFVVSVWLIVRTVRGKSGRLPGFSSFAEEFCDKHLS
ncbi:MAG: hypothetical protein QNJ47_18790 [Nostocaceae cyanobacterium]|nr:hypothetical protein [Nostocaceae cyanobacterium]